MEISKDTLLEMYRRMVRIREFELASIDLFKRGQVKGAVHPYIGQEASGVGVCMALRQDDLIAGTHRSHGHAMPGMLTQAQLEELDAARALEFDRLFLTYMIQHHGGAVTMVHDLFGADGAGQDRAVFKLASDIQVDQITEIERMKQMLDTMAEQGDGR